MRKFITLSFFLFYAAVFFAQTFTGFVDDDWSKAVNWFPAFVPTSTSSVTIGSGTTCKVYTGTTAVIKQIAFLGGSLTVDGVLIVDGSPGEAIPVQGSITVNGILGAVNSFDDGIHIYPGGQITVNFAGNLASNVSFNGNGIYSDGIMQNNGTITITNPALNGYENRGIFSNSGTLNVSGSTNNGLLNRQNMTSTGQLNVNNSGGYGIYLFSGSAAFVNGGSININNPAICGLRCDADFFNAIGKTILIDGSLGCGLKVSSGVTIINNGLITASNSSHNGVHSEGDFTNSGIINIEHSGDAGLANLPAGSFTNNLGVLIDDADVGLYTQGNFANASSSLINIKNTIQQGLIQESATSFDNSGEIILSAIGADGIDLLSTGSFSNSGSLTLNGGIAYASTGIFINTGLIKGTGNIKGSHFLNVGDIAPGLSPGVLTISEMYDHSGGNYLAEIDPGIGNDLLVLPDVVTALDGVLTLTATSNPAPGTTYTIISSPVTDISGMTFSIENLPSNWAVIYNTNSVDVIYLGVLPVELVSFKGEKKRNGIQLSWRTATEKNNDGFELLRSSDGQSWESITWVKGNGTSNNVHDYSYLDQTPNAGVNFYQLKQMDFDGEYEMSKSISVNWKERVSISIYPNPAKDDLTVNLPVNAIPQEIYLLDMTGRILHQLDWNQGHISLGNVPGGVYFLRIKMGNDTYTEKLIVE